MASWGHDTNMDAAFCVIRRQNSYLPVRTITISLVTSLVTSSLVISRVTKQRLHCGAVNVSLNDGFDQRAYFIFRQ